MECKVKTAFFDKYTGKYHAVGTSYFCSKERFSEIQKQGDFLAEKKEAKKSEE